MAHKFFNSSSNTSGLPSRTATTLWEKITKKAHDVWSVSDEGGSTMLNRLRGETVNAREEEPVHAHSELLDENGDIAAGDIVLLFMGGRKSTARVASVHEGQATVELDNGQKAHVPVEWLKQADDRTETPEDAKSMVADSLNALLHSRGGLCAVRLSPSTMMSLQNTGTGIQVRMFEISTRQMHSGTYQDVNQLVNELHLTNYPEEIDANALLKTR